MVRLAAYCQFRVDMLGSEVGETTPAPKTPLIWPNWVAMLEFTAPVPPALEPICRTFTLCMLPFEALYWKTPACAPALNTLALAEMLCG
jgi:hypothetical protein